LRHAGYQTNVVLVEPAGCDSRAGVFVDHRLEGMAVGVKPPLLDWDLVSETMYIDQDTMLAAQHRFAAQHGYFVGNTSAACIAVAQELKGRSNNRHKVFTSPMTMAYGMCNGSRFKLVVLAYTHLSL
jgi:cysteine synthase